MAPDVRKYHVEASKNVRPYQQSYVSQYGDKLPANDQQNLQRNQKMGCTTQEVSKNNDQNKNDK